MKRSSRFSSAFFMSCAAFVLASCGGGGSTGSQVHGVGALPQTPTTPVSSQLRLYVPNLQPFLAGQPTSPPTANSVAVFAATASGNVTPMQLITGPSTQLTDSSGVQVDSKGNIYVANAACCAGNPLPPSVTVYAPDATGDVAPIRMISGSNTTFASPSDVAFDRADNLYVADFRGGPPPGNGTVLLFNAGANGNVAPIATIGGPKTTLSLPTGITLDSAGNVYVTNLELSSCAPNGSITVFAAGASGDTAPIAIISGNNSRVFHPQGVALDASGKIYVANQPFLVTVFAPGANGNIAPIQEIHTAFSPSGIAVDPEGNIYVSGTGLVAVFAPGASGNAAPIRTISGSNTSLELTGLIAIH